MSYSCKSEHSSTYECYIDGWGVPKRFPGPNAFHSVQRVKIGGTDWEANVPVKIVETWTSNPIAELTYNGGTPIYYGKITECKWYDSGNKIWTDYFYSTPRLRAEDSGEIHFEYLPGEYYDPIGVSYTLKDKPVGTPYDFINFGDEQYGQLLRKTEYAEDENGKVPVMQEDYEYEFETSGLYTEPQYIYRVISFHPERQLTEEDIAKGESYAVAGTSDIPYEYTTSTTYNKLKRSSITQYYPSGDSFTTVKDYSYVETVKGSNGSLSNQVGLKPRTVTSTYSNGKQKVDIFAYSDGHYPITHYPEVLHPTVSSTEITPPKNILLEHKSVIDGDTTYTRQKMDKVSNGFFKISSIKSKYPHEIKFQEALEIKHDVYGNIVETKGLDGIPTSYIWSYDNQYIAAKIVNASHSEVDTALAKRGISVSTNMFRTLSFIGETDEKDLESLRESLPKAQIYTYLYQPLTGAMIKATDPSGKATYYEYDSLSRLSRVYFKEKTSTGGYVERTIESYKYNLTNKY